MREWCAAHSASSGPPWQHGVRLFRSTPQTPGPACPHLPISVVAPSPRPVILLTLVSFSCASRSSPGAKRHWMYSLGVCGVRGGEQWRCGCECMWAYVRGRTRAATKHVAVRVRMHQCAPCMLPSRAGCASGRQQPGVCPSLLFKTACLPRLPRPSTVCTTTTTPRQPLPSPPLPTGGARIPPVCHVPAQPTPGPTPCGNTGTLTPSGASSVLGQRPYL